MKVLRPFFLLCVAYLATSYAQAQNSALTVFSEQGERFWLILNGIKQNEKALAHVKVNKLQAGAMKIKIVFENQTLGELDKTGYFEPNQAITTRIKKNKKGQYVLRLLDIAEVQTEPAPTSTPAEIEYHTEALPATPTYVPDVNVTKTPTEGTLEKQGEKVGQEMLNLGLKTTEDALKLQQEVLKAAGEDIKNGLKNSEGTENKDPFEQVEKKADEMEKNMLDNTIKTIDESLKLQQEAVKKTNQEVKKVKPTDNKTTKPKQ